MIPHGTPEWYEARLGKVTASRISDVIARTKTGWGASRGNYCAELVLERLTGAPAEHYVSPAMQEGTEREAQAIAAYQWRTGADTEPGGYVDHPRLSFAGASPDLRVGKDGLAEFKCPEKKAHLETLLGASVRDRYGAQMQWQLACCPGRQWCDFVSFHPDFPPSMRLHVTRFERDEKRIAELEEQVSAFLAEVAGKVADLRRLYSVPEPEAQARRWEDLKLAMRAGIRCAEPAFQRFLGVTTEAEAAQIVRERCGVGSRKELDASQEAAGAWGALEGDFWLTSRGYAS